MVLNVNSLLGKWPVCQSHMWAPRPLVTDQQKHVLFNLLDMQAGWVLLRLNMH